MAVVHEAVAQIAGVSPGTVGFAELPGLSVTAGVVSLIEEQRATEITLGTLLPLATVEPNQLTPLSGGGSSSEPSIRSSELWEAQARSGVPSIEKCSELSSGWISGVAINSSRNLATSSL